ncbi:GPO family capsid scaffolding protein [Stutzerimonas stutzeri]|uniref:GPO family capsid scaffolding protein n=1 Tax=Stutzerimonas stutzeri TaxID=316 RepID=UPI00210C312A|nr:GPO family capsid scaffolding protein [Stutzerimonas stutzeri]MCQ4319735.1 GPO family capsid scaffolding protein [Stutzerimonas stutzeri]
MKKFRSRWFRIGVEGATTDGRKIERSWLEEMAASYSRDTYGARLNVEHIKGLSPDSQFGAYGDVLALKVEEVDVNGEQKLALFAQIQPNDSLLALNKKGQKIYTSMEIQPKFSDTGRAYLVGLAVTDSPASLGTEALEFSAQHGTLTSRKQDKDNLFSAAEEAALEFDEVTEQPSAFKDLANRVKALFTKGKEADSQFAEIGDAVTALVEFAEKQQAALDAYSTKATNLDEQVTKLEATVTELTAKLEKVADPQQFKRPPVSGGNGQILAAF